jgi:putative glutamine amidotransferase
MSRPLIAIPGRFASKSTGIRLESLALADRLLASVYEAGGEPVLVYPRGLDEMKDRLSRFDGLLLPGGSDVDPHLYGANEIDPSVYGVNTDQDAFDIAAFTASISMSVPTLAICRGFQIVNVALGGSLEQDMRDPHRDRIHPIGVTGRIAEITGSSVMASCYHHQRVDRLADGLRVLATDDDGTVEAADLPSASGWFVGLQWHPEDTASQDSSQSALFVEFVKAAAEFASARR